MTALGKFIRSERIKHGITQSELARRIGCDSTYVNMIESGKKRPEGASLLEALATAFELDEKGRNELSRAAALSQRTIRVPDDLDDSKRAMLSEIVQELPHFSASEAAILSGVFNVFRQHSAVDQADTRRINVEGQPM